MFLAFEYTPHPSIHVKIPTLFMWDKFLCKDRLIMDKAAMKAVKKFSSEGVSVLVGEW